MIREIIQDIATFTKIVDYPNHDFLEDAHIESMLGLIITNNLTLLDSLEPVISNYRTQRGLCLTIDTYKSSTFDVNKIRGQTVFKVWLDKNYMNLNSDILNTLQAATVTVKIHIPFWIPIVCV